MTCQSRVNILRTNKICPQIVVYLYRKKGEIYLKSLIH